MTIFLCICLCNLGGSDSFPWVLQCSAKIDARTTGTTGRPPRRFSTPGICTNQHYYLVEQDRDVLLLQGAALPYTEYLNHHLIKSPPHPVPQKSTSSPLTNPKPHHHSIHPKSITPAITAPIPSLHSATRPAPFVVGTSDPVAPGSPAPGVSVPEPVPASPVPVPVAVPVPEAGGVAPVVAVPPAPPPAPGLYADVDGVAPVAAGTVAVPIPAPVVHSPVSVPPPPAPPGPPAMGVAVAAAVAVPV